MTPLSIFWSYVKKYWQYALLIIGAIVAAFLFRQKDLSFADELKKIQDVHAAELAKIQAARDEERRQHEANLKQLQVALDAVQKEYDAAKKDLDSKKKAEIESIVTQYKDDPETLAKKLSESTGFVIILPQ